MIHSEITRLFLPALGLFGLTSLAQAQSDLYTINGVGSEDLMGFSVAPAGLYNADTDRDIIAGAPENFIIFTAGNGRASVHNGATGSVIHTFLGDDTFDQFGITVDGGFDYNNDGRDDVIVGAPLASPNGSASGFARVFSGATNGLLFQIDGISVGQQLGGAVSYAGDVNNDGFDDVIVGAAGDNTMGSDAGMVRVISGFDNSIIWEIFGAGANDNFGVAVCDMGDLNGDGFDEFAVGSIFDGVTIFRGDNMAVWDHFPSTGRNDFYGAAIANAGDVNGDMINDIVIGASQRAGLTALPGFAEVRSGATGGLIDTIPGDAPGDRMGISVDGAGDLNGDGRAEVIIGADQFSVDDGYARVIDGMTGNTLFDITNNSGVTDLALGTSVAGLGDVNGDGSMEVAAGQPLDGVAPNIVARGSVRVVSGPGMDPGGCMIPTPYCIAGVNSAGTQAMMGSIGTTSVSTNQFFLTVDGAIPNGFGIFFYGPNQLSGVTIPGTSSFRCIGGGIFRLGGGSADNTGSNGRRVNFNAGNPSSGAGMIVPGATWNFGYVYRDTADTGNVPLNWSNGLSATFCP